jgi:Flp pilus assembly protein TadG
VVPLLMVMFMGILDFGLLFNNSLGLRQGVRQAAREGVVGNFTGCTAATPPSTDLGKLACATRLESAPVAGTSYAMVSVPSGTWAKNNVLLVCGLTRTTGATGLTPMPNSGWMRSKVKVAIEVTATPTGMSTVSDTLPAGTPASMAWASWCS